MENGRRGIGGPKHSNSKYASKVPFNVSTKVDTEESIQKKTLKKINAGVKLILKKSLLTVKKA